MMKTAIVPALICLSAFTASAEDLVLNGDHPVSVASGSTETVSAKVTGSGRIVLVGGGTLVLDNSANDFTGGIVVSNGIVRADASGAFGTGPITLEGTNSLRKVQFNAAGGVFANSITLCTTGTAEDVVHVMENATVVGNITTSEDYADTKNYLRIRLGESLDNRTCDASGYPLPKTVLDGEMNVGRVMTLGSGSLVCNRKVTVSGLAQFGNGSRDRGVVYLCDGDSRIAYLMLKSFDVSCMAENVLKDCQVRFSFPWGPNGFGFVLLNGFDQEVRYLNYSENNSYVNIRPDGYSCGIRTHNDFPATVTVRGPGSANGYCSVGGPVSIVIDKSPEADWLYQRFQYRENNTTGDFTVKNGSCYLNEGVSFPNVRNLAVTGGYLEISNVTNCMGALEKMTVLGGKVAFGGGCVNALSADSELHLSSEAKFYIKTGITNTVKRLYLDGKVVGSGVYTHEDLAVMLHDSKPEDYAGVLIVKKGLRFNIIVR